MHRTIKPADAHEGREPAQCDQSHQSRRRKRELNPCHARARTALRLLRTALRLWHTVKVNRRGGQASGRRDWEHLRGGGPGIAFSAARAAPSPARGRELSEHQHSLLAVGVCAILPLMRVRRSRRELSTHQLSLPAAGRSVLACAGSYLNTTRAAEPGGRLVTMRV